MTTPLSGMFGEGIGQYIPKRGDLAPYLERMREPLRAMVEHGKTTVQEVAKLGSAIVKHREVTHTGHDDFIRILELVQYATGSPETEVSIDLGCGATFSSSKPGMFIDQRV